MTPEKPTSKEIAAHPDFRDELKKAADPKSSTAGELYAVDMADVGKPGRPQGIPKFEPRKGTH